MWLLRNKNDSIEIELYGAIVEPKEGICRALPVFATLEANPTYYCGEKATILNRIDLSNFELFEKTKTECNKKYFIKLVSSTAYDNSYVAHTSTSSMVIYTNMFFAVGIKIRCNQFVNHTFVISATPVTDDTIEHSFELLEQC